MAFVGKWYQRLVGAEEGWGKESWSKGTKLQLEFRSFTDYGIMWRLQFIYHVF